MRSFQPPTKGDHVLDLQRALISRGYTLPRFGADGSMSAEGETVAALSAWALDKGFVGAEDGLQGLEIQVAAEELIMEYAALMSSSQSDPTKASYSKLLPGRGSLVKGMRQWNKIDSIVLHQTGTTRGLVWKDVPIHIGVPRDEACFYRIQPLQALLYHANGFNGRSVGIEIEGNYCGIAGRRETLWAPGGGPSPLVGSMIAYARHAVHHIIATVRASGGEIKFIFAHRQASKDRIADPGEEIWREVGLWAQKEFGLSDGGPGYKVGTGYELPNAWTGDGRAYGYWR